MDREIELKLLKGYRLTTLQIFYYNPDYRSIINEFIYQLLDVSPRYPKSHEFLIFWKNNIVAPIKEIHIAQEDDIYPSSYRNVNYVNVLNKFNQ